jgi:outer membrane protein assembly factor BamD (BamD/ComL family)
MSVSSISSSSLLNYSTQNVQSRMQEFKKEFQQLGQDLSSGNISAAQSDFASLQQLGPQSSSSSSVQSNNPITNDFNQLATDLQSGDVTAAQQDYTKVQQDFQNQASAVHHHRHHGGGGGNTINQMFEQLGQDLQSGDVSGAQQAYASLQQDLQQFGTGELAQSTTLSSSVSVNA